MKRTLSALSLTDNENQPRAKRRLFAPNVSGLVGRGRGFPSVRLVKKPFQPSVRPSDCRRGSVRKTVQLFKQRAVQPREILCEEEKHEEQSMDCDFKLELSLEDEEIVTELATVKEIEMPVQEEEVVVELGPNEIEDEDALCMDGEEDEHKVSYIFRSKKPMAFPTDLLNHIMGFMTDDQLFQNRMVSKSFHKAYYNQRVLEAPCVMDLTSPWPTFLPSQRFNAVRALRLAQLGKVFPNVTCLDLGGTLRTLRGVERKSITPAMFPKLSTLYLIGSGIGGDKVAQFPSLTRLAVNRGAGSVGWNGNKISPQRFPGLKLVMECRDTRRVELFRVVWSK